MSKTQSQLKTALISAIKEKELKILESKKSLLKFIEDSVNEEIKKIDQNCEAAESFSEKQLTEMFSKLVEPTVSKEEVGVLITIINILHKPNSKVFSFNLNKLIGAFNQNNQVDQNTTNFFSNFFTPNIPGMPWNFPPPGSFQPNNWNQPMQMHSQMQPPQQVNLWGQPARMQPMQDFGQGYNQQSNDQCLNELVGETSNVLLNTTARLNKIYKSLVEQNVGNKILEDINFTIEVINKSYNQTKGLDVKLKKVFNKLRKANAGFKFQGSFQPWNELDMIEAELANLLLAEKID